MAYNTIGWQAQNILFQTIDTLLGTDGIGTQNPAAVKAVVEDSPLIATGAINVTANNDAHIRATLGNKTDSQATAFMDATGKAVGVALGSNLVSTDAEAKIVSSSTTKQKAQAGTGGITVHATDNTGIRAHSKLQSISSTTNDAGLGLAYDALAQAAGVDYTDKSGSRAVKQYDVVVIDAIDYSTYDTPDSIQKHDRIQLEFDLSGGAAGDVFEYIHGTEINGGVDLESQNYADQSRWRKVLATPEEAYMFVGSAATLDLGTQDYAGSSNWVPMKLADPRNVIPGLSLSITDSDSAAFGGLFVRNDVRSDVDAFLHYVDADTPGKITVHADLTGVIDAQTRSTVTSSGGSMFGEGMSVAVNAVVATNTILSSAEAYATHSDLTTTGTGDIHVKADNTSEIKADVTSRVESNGYGIGVTLAFNTVGWASQNVLFNTVDTIIGGVIGTKQPAATKAYIENSTINSADDVLVETKSNAAIDARISNVNSTVSVTPAGGSDTVTVGATLTMNKVATDVQARIKNATTFVANGDVKVTADDSSRIVSEVEASSIAVGAGMKSSSGISVGLALSRNEIDNNVVALLDTIGTTLNAAQVTGGDVLVSTTKDAKLNATVVSTAVAVSAAVGKSLAVSGGGALAFNNVLGSNDAIIQNAKLTTKKGGGKTGGVSVVADDSSAIDAIVRSVNVALAIGTKPVPAVALGMAVATNRIGWNSATATAKYNSDRSTKLTTLLTGDTVQVMDGPLLGRVYKYTGPKITDSSAAGIQLGSLNYHDRSAWEPQGLTANAARIHALVKTSTLTINDGALIVDADSRSSINAQVLAGSAAVAASAKAGVAVAAAGVFTSNVIRIDNSAQVIGSTVTANSAAVTSDDKAGIKAVAGAASLAASLSGKASVSVSIALSLAFNEISGTTLADVTGGSVTTDTAGVNVSASSQGIPLFNFTLANAATQLDDAADKAQDNGDTKDTDEAAVDAAADLVILNAIAAAFQSAGHKLGDVETVAADWTYTTGDTDADHAQGHVNITKGDRVRLNQGYGNGGIGGRVYEFVGNTATRFDLASADYSTASWKLVSAPPRLTLLEKGKAWLLVAGDGTSFTLRLSDTVANQIEITRNNISVISAAASAGLAIGGKAGVAVSGAGAVSINTILTKTDAQLVNTIVSSATSVTVNSVNSAAIDATTVAASVAVGGGGAAGIGASIGVAVAKNLVGFHANGTAGKAHVRSRISNSSVTATSGNLTLQAVSSQRIGAMLFSGSVAIGLGGKAGVAVSGSGVYGENRIDMDVESSISGDGATGISATDVVLNATDQSLISAFAGAASVSAAFGGVAGVSVSVGAAISRNSISSSVNSYILNADSDVKASGKVSVTAAESASIQVMAMAASVAAGFAGVAGVAVSGAGADAANFISTSTNAHITSSDVVATGDVLVSATNSAKIESRVFAASVGIGVGGKAGVGASIGVALARNFIGWGAGTPVATTHRSGSTKSIATNDTVLIDTGVRQGEIYKYIGKARTDVNLRTEDYGNPDAWQRIDLVSDLASVTAKLVNSSVVTAGKLDVKADSTAKIQAETFAGSVAIGGGLVGVGVSGVGASTQNRIATQIHADIHGQRTGGVKAAAITVEAKDKSDIDAKTGAAAIGGGFGLVGVSISIGVALASNEISNDVRAKIDSATTRVETTGGALTIRSLDESTIDAYTVSSALSVSGGAVGVALSGAGANATNVILSNSQAFIKGSTVVTVGNLVLDATSTSAINATVAAVAASASGAAGVAVGMAIGAATAQNFIGYNQSGTAVANMAGIKAYITSSDVLVQGTLSQLAKSKATVNSTVKAGSVAAAASGLAAAAGAGAGASTKNRIGQTVEAYISATTGSGVRFITGTIDAQDQSTINSKTGAASLAASLAPKSVAVSTSVALADNVISNTVQSYVVNSTLKTLADFTSSTSGQPAIKVGDRVQIANSTLGRIGAIYKFKGLNANHQSSVGTKAVNPGELVQVSTGHASGKGTIGAIYKYKGVKIDFQTTHGSQDLKTGNHVFVGFDYETTKGKPGSVYRYKGADAKIDVSKEDYTDTAKWELADTINLNTQDYTNTALWEIVSSIKLGEQDYSNTAVWEEVLDPLTITASENATISSIAAAASTALGAVAVSGGGANATNVIDTTTSATVSGASTVLRIGGDLTVSAINTSKATSTTGSSSIAGGIVSIAAGGSTTYVNIKPRVTAKITDGSTSADDIVVKASAVPSALTTTYGVRAGTIAVGGSFGSIDINPIVTTTVGGTIVADSLKVSSLTERPTAEVNGQTVHLDTASARGFGSSGGLVGVDGIKTVVKHGGSVSSDIATSANFTVSGATAILASSVGLHRATASSIVVGGLSVGKTTTELHSSTNVSATVGASAKLTGGSFSIAASRDHDQLGDNIAGTGGVIAGASAESITKQSGSVSTQFLAAANINVTGGIAVAATSRSTGNGRIKTVSGGALAGAGADIKNTVSSTVLVDVKNNVKLSGASLEIDAGNVFSKPKLGTDNIRGTTGGIASAASAHSLTTVTFDTKVNLGNSAELTVVGTEADPGKFAVRSLNDINAYDKVSFTTGGALSGAKSSSIIRSTSNKSAVVTGTGTKLNAPGAIEISARGKGDIETKGNTETFGIATVALSDTVSEVHPHNTITLGGGTQIKADGDVLISTGVDTNFARDDYRVHSVNDAFAGSAIPIDDIDALARMYQTNTITVNSGALVESAGDIKLHAERQFLSDMHAKSKGVTWASAAADAVNSAFGGQENFGGDIQTRVTGVVTVDGILRTGTKRKRSVTLGAIDKDGNPIGWDHGTGIIDSTYITTDLGTTSIPVTQGKDTASSGLFQELLKARSDLAEYGAQDARLKTFLTAEIARMEAELIAAGLGELAPDGSFLPIESEVMTVNVPLLRAQAGVIDVRADALTGAGAGTIDGPGDANVKILNHTPAQLNILGINIPQSNGGLYLNGQATSTAAEVNAINIDGYKSAKFKSITPHGSSNSPQIHVENTFNASTYTGTYDGDAISYANPNIVVKEEVNNLSGGWTAKNKKGDILYKASVNAADFVTIAGGSVFVDGATNFTAGGDIYGRLIADSDNNSSAKGINAFTDLTPVTKGNSSSIVLGDTVYIDAEFINVAGVIQSGKESHDLTIPEWWSVYIPLFVGRSGTRFFNMPSIHPDFDIQYDRVQDRLLVKELRTSGGKVTLKGHILSTGAGEIKVRDGYADVNIKNLSRYDIELETIDASRRGQGSLLLIDKAQKDASGKPKITLYGHTDGATTPVDGKYDPQSNYRFGFAVGQVTRTRITTTYGTSSWLGVDALSADPSNIRSGPHREVLEQPKLLPESSYFYVDSNPALKDYEVSGLSQTNLKKPTRRKDAQWTKKKWWGKKTVYQRWVEETLTRDVRSHNFAADKSITISFIGQTEADVTVVSDKGGKIILSGPIRNTSGVTKLSSTAGIEQESEDASIGGRRVELISGANISGTGAAGVVTNIANVANSSLYTSAAGLIQISELSGPIAVDRVISTGGKSITLNAPGGFTSTGSAAANLSGGSITLNGNLGGIGTSAAPLKINSGALSTHHFVATAANSIYLTETSGNLHAKSIVSETGDVEITLVDGGLIDANKLESRDERTYNELANGLWKDLQLTAGSGANTKVTETLNTFRDSKTQDYQTYWDWRGDSPYSADLKIKLTTAEDTFYREFYRAEGTAAGKSGTELDAFVDAAIATLENSRTVQFHTQHSVWAAYDRGSYSAGDLTAKHVTDFTYELSTAEDAQLRGSIKIWTENELLHAIGGGLLKEITDTQATIEADNLSGRNVKITAAKGQIGTYTTSVNIDLTRDPLNLTTDERVALASAERSDVLFVAGDKVTGSFNFVPDVNGDIIGRTSGSWITDGYKAGLHISIETASGNATSDRAWLEIQSVTASELQLVQADKFTAETGRTATITQVALNPQHVFANAGNHTTADFTFTRDAVNGDTITRSTGNWLSDGFAVGKFVRVDSGENKTPTGTYWEIKSATASELRLIESNTVKSGTFTSKLTVITLESVVLTAIEIAQRDDIDITATGDVSVSAKNAIFLGSEQDLKTKSVRAGGIVSLKTAGAITNTGPADIEVIQSGSLVLEAAGGGIGTAAKPFVIALPGDATFTARAKNDIYIVELEKDLDLETVYSQQGNITLSASDGSIVDVFNNSLDNIKAGKSITLTATGSIGFVTNPLDIDQGAATTSVLTASAVGIFLRETLGNIHVASVDGKTGDVVLEAHQYIRDIDAKAADNKDVIGNSITLNSINGGIGGLGKELEIDSGAADTDVVTLSAQLDSIYVTETGGDLHLNTVGTVGSDTFTFLTASSGKILDARLDSNSKNILSGNVYLLAAQDIGTAAEPILTQISKIQGEATNGKTYIHNAGHLIVDKVNANASTGILAGGDVQLSASSPLTVNSDVIAAGDIIITATESAVTGDDITVNAGNSITSSTGIIRLLAGDNVIINDGTALSSPALIEIAAAHDDADSTSTGATIQIDGVLSAPLIHVSTGEFNDNVSIAAATAITGVAIVEAREGDDTVTNNATTSFADPLFVFGDAVNVDYNVTTHELSTVETAGPGAGGNDILTSTAGFALLVGGHGKDTITGGSGDEWAIAGEIAATLANNKLTDVSNTGTDPAAGETIDVGDGTNFVLGGLGPDSITAGIGTNTIFGDEGLFEVDSAGNLTFARSVNPNAGAPDTFTLGSGTYRVIAGAGNEIISLGAGSNYVIGDAGSIDVTAGHTTIASITSAAPGDDTITVSDGTNVVIGGGGTDTITVTAGASAISSIIGDDGELTLGSNGKPISLASTNFGVGARDIIELADGTSAVIGGTGNDEITAGDGHNTILGDDGTATFFANGDLKLIESTNLGNGGTDTIQLDDGTNTVIAGAKLDIINIGGGTNFVFADEGRREVTATNIIAESLNAAVGGKDQITVGPGYNVIAGGADEDTITVNGTAASARGIVLGDNGEMTLDLAGNLLEITSTEFASGAKDIITLTSGTNAIIGGAGNDEITAGDGHNTILGDDGTATFFTNGNLKLIESTNLGNGGTDTIQLDDGTNTVIAGAKSDIISIGGGTNFVFADEGRREVTATNIIAESLNAAVGGKDQITVGPGYNVIAGGADEDTITVNGTAASARGIVLGDNGEMTLDLSGNLLEITSTEFASGAKDIITLTSGTNAIIGGSGNDEITAGDGHNTILGDDGTATFFANGDLELIESINLGNGGIDTIQLDDGTNTVIAGAKSDIINIGGGTNFVFADEGRREVTATNIIAESLNAAVGGKDQITVGPGYNVIAGGADEDTITVNGTAASARGIVLGDNGEMTLDLAGNLLEITSTEFASGAKDIITLTSGTNAIIGGAGDDEITAGDGHNTILGDDGTATFFANGDLELIESINLGNGGTDTIQLDDGTNTVIAGAKSDIINIGGGTNFVFADEGRREVTATNSLQNH